MGCYSSRDSSCDRFNPLTSWRIQYQIRIYNPPYLFISFYSLLERTLCLEWFVKMQLKPLIEVSPILNAARGLPLYRRLAGGELPPILKLSASESLFSALVFIAVSFVNGF